MVCPVGARASHPPAAGTAALLGPYDMNKFSGLFFGCLLLTVAVDCAKAECFDLSGNKINLSYLECEQHSYVYAGKIEPSARDFLLGAWSTDCTDQTSRLFISTGADGVITTVLQTFDPASRKFVAAEGGSEAKIIEARIVGDNLFTSTFAMNHSDMIYNSFASRLYGTNKRRFINDQMLVFATASGDQSTSARQPEIRVRIRDGVDLNTSQPTDTPVIERCSTVKK